MSRKAERKKAREEKKARKREIKKERRGEIATSLIEIYNKMSVTEQILSSIALAFGILSIFIMGSFVLDLITTSIVVILTILTVMLYQGRQKRNKRFLKFIEIQKEIDIKSINELIGWSEKNILSIYIDIISTGNKELFYDLKTKKMHWKGQVKEVSTNQTNEIRQDKVYCTYCGSENEINVSYCISCGDPII